MLFKRDDRICHKIVNFSERATISQQCSLEENFSNCLIYKDFKRRVHIPPLLTFFRSMKYRLLATLVMREGGAPSLITHAELRGIILS